MSHEDIKKNYLRKIRKITKLNKSYYDNSDPLISDSEYDNLKKEIISLEKKYSFLNNKN